MAVEDGIKAPNITKALAFGRKLVAISSILILLVLLLERGRKMMALKTTHGSPECANTLE